jgi:adenylate kinase family enzyme
MDRVVIIGCSGSGKSTLARAIGARTGLPVHHLDKYYWQPGWKPHPDEAAFQARMRALTEEPRWIIDGGFTSGSMTQRLARADTVVLFDLPAWLCLYRALKRLAAYRGETRPDLAPGCPERFDLEFYRYIWTYRRAKLPRVEAQIAEGFRGRLVRLRTERDRTAFLSTLPPAAR